MQITTLVAVYGAILSTVVAGWSAYQWWKAGARLKGRVSINMTGYGHMAELDGTYLLLSVSNRGKAATTITHAFTERYKNWLSFVFKHQPKQHIIVGTLRQFSIPFKLEPGQEFASLMIQDDEVEEWSRTCRFYFCVMHTMSDRPVRSRIPAIKCHAE